MPRRPSPLPAHLPEAFSIRSARAAGVTRRRLDARDLDAPFRGTRRRLAPPAHMTDPDESPVARESRRLRREIITRVRAYLHVAPAGAVISHATAAVIWNLPVPLRILRRTVREVDVSVLGARRAPKAAGIAGHQLRPAMTGVTEHDGIPLTSPATTWALMAPRLTVDELIEIGDAIVHIPRRRGLERGLAGEALGRCDQLAAAIDAGRRMGAAKLRAALPQIRVGSASPGETRVRLACARAGLPDAELDIDVFALDGRPIGFTELGYPRYRVLVEYEGDHHRRDIRQWNRDIDKYAACVEAGWDVVRLTAQHTAGDAQRGVARIHAALLRGGWTHGAP